MSTPRTLLLLGATLTTGLSAGVIALYAHTIMPGLKTTSDRTFVAAFQAIDRAIINPWFMGTFFGALVLTAAAAATNRGRPAFAWLIAALALYVAVVVITMAVNVPLNDAVKTAGNPAEIDVAKVREDFHDARWVAWNLVRPDHARDRPPHQTTAVTGPRQPRPAQTRRARPTARCASP